MPRCHHPRYRHPDDNETESKFCSKTCVRVFDELMQRPSSLVPVCALPGCTQNAAPYGRLRDYVFHETCRLAHHRQLEILKASAGGTVVTWLPPSPPSSPPPSPSLYPCSG